MNSDTAVTIYSIHENSEVDGLEYSISGGSLDNSTDNTDTSQLNIVRNMNVTTIEPKKDNNGNYTKAEGLKFILLGKVSIVEVYTKQSCHHNNDDRRQNDNDFFHS